MGFKKGEGGRPKGARNKLTREMRELLEGEVSRQGPEGFRQFAEVELPPFSGVLATCGGEFRLGSEFVVHGGLVGER